MTWRALVEFVGVIAGAEKPFAAGDEITDADAAELGLAAKPDLAEQVEADAKTPQA